MSLVDQSGTVGHFGPENSREIQSVPGLNQSVCSCVREWPTWFLSGTVEPIPSPWFNEDHGSGKSQRISKHEMTQQKATQATFEVTPILSCPEFPRDHRNLPKTEIQFHIVFICLFYLKIQVQLGFDLWPISDWWSSLQATKGDFSTVWISDVTIYQWLSIAYSLDYLASLCDVAPAYLSQNPLFRPSLNHLCLCSQFHLTLWDSINTRCSPMGLCLLCNMSCSFHLGCPSLSQLTNFYS